MDIHCPDCNMVLDSMVDILEANWQREESKSILYLKCPKCTREFIPEIILHPRLQYVKIETKFIVPEN